MRRLSARTGTAALAAIGAAVLALPLLAAGPAQAAPTADLSITKQVINRGNLDVINVPGDFSPVYSATRSLGSYWLVPTGLRIKTEARPVPPPPGLDQRKVAEYIDTYTPLSAVIAPVAPPTLEYTVISGPRPGYQLVTDLDNNGTPDVILVGENDFGANWWAANIAGPWVTAGATPCPGSRFCRTLAGWSGAFPDAKVLAFGFTLGSGATGEGVINAINFAGVHYTFAGGSMGPSTQAGPGETVEYMLTVRNGSTPGTLPATDVVVTDVLPPELTYVPGTLIDSGNNCSFSGQTLTCQPGTYPAGVASTIRFQAEVDDELTTTTSGQVVNQGHWVDVQKNETFADLPAGQTRTYSTFCSPGFLATDGGLLVDAVDQGGSYADLVISESKPTTQGGLNGWTVTTRNTGLFRGQGKVKVTCLGADVGSNDGHTHSITLSSSTGTGAILPAAPASTADVVTRTCPSGYTPVAPEFSVTQGSAVIRASRAVGSDWRWTVDHPAGTNATFNVSCLPPRTNTTQAHMSDLQISTKTDTVAFNAGTRGEGQLTCDNGGNGLVGGWDQAPVGGPLSLGMESRGNAYMFRFFNPQPASASADIQLACVGVRTANEAKFYHVINTASVTTTAPDASAADNSSTTDVAVNMDALAAPNRGVTVDSTGARTVVLSKTTTIGLAVKCPASCTFTARVYYGNQVVAKGPFTLAGAPGWQSIQVPTTDAGTYQGPGPTTVRIKTADGTTTFKVTLS